MTAHADNPLRNHVTCGHCLACNQAITPCLEDLDLHNDCYNYLFFRTPAPDDCPNHAYLKEGKTLPTRRTQPLTLLTAEAQHGKSWQLKNLTRKDGQHLCYNCNAPATGWSSMNVWGTIVDYESCDACHALHDGTRADIVPRPRD